MVRFARFLLPVALVAAPAAAQVPEADLAAATPVIDAEPMPVAPAMVAASFVTPSRDAQGRYATPNRDLSGDEAVWHLRVALNVAALGCRDADEAATVAAYNGLLAAARDRLGAAQAAVAVTYQARYGAAAQARNDDAMTRLYNFFAQPTGHDDFCAAAKSVLAEVATVEPAALAPYAAAALPRLEAPFLAFFAHWDAYRASLARWQARRTAPTMLAATVAPVPVALPTPARPASTTAPVTITLTADALKAILAGDVPGITIAATAVASTPATTETVVLASVR